MFGQLGLYGDAAVIRNGRQPSTHCWPFLCILVTGVLFLIAPAAQARPVEVSSGWSITRSPNPQAENGFLNWVSCSGASACTAVGSYVRGSSVGATLAERRDGDAWTIEPTPNPAGARVSALQGVSC